MLVIAVGGVSVTANGISRVSADAVTPSTNAENQSKGWAHVVVQDTRVGEVDLQFVSTRGFASCFEYRTDGDVTQKTSDINYNPAVTDGLYPFYCLNNNTRLETFEADEYVEVRMVFGAESDERFDWTRFDVATPPTTPQILGFLNPALSCGAVTNIKTTTVDWSDSTGGEGGIAGYDYHINYPLPAGGFGNWSTFVVTSQRTGALNEGVHTIKVRAKDMAGNFSEFSDTCTITTDWTAPDVMITNPEDGALLSGIVDVRGSVEDANPHHYWFVIQNSEGTVVAGPGVVNDPSSFVDKTLLSWDTTTVPNGVYTIKLEARDAANNKDGGSSDWHSVTVNNLPPVTSPTDMNQCKNGGWMNFEDPTFKNQGDCVSFVQSNAKAVGNKTR